MGRKALFGRWQPGVPVLSAACHDVRAASRIKNLGIPLALVSPVFALMLNLPGQALGALFASLLLGTAVLSLVGGIGAALTVGLKRGGMLISLLILPLYMPVLIFGSAAVQAAVNGSPAAPYLAILGAMLCLAIALAPIAMAAGLRISVDA